MEKVIYKGADDAQVAWGNCDDPRGVLKAGGYYEIERKNVHSWHTKIKLVGIEGWFNSVSFKEE